MINGINFQKKTYYPSKIVCIGRNYVEHIHELANEIPAEPVIFIKPNSSIASDLYLDETDAIHYEGEISLLIQSGHFIGVGFGLDLTKRNVQTMLKKKGLPWERAKAFDNSALFSEFVPITGSIAQLRMELSINENIVQQGDYSLMLNKPDVLLNEVKTFLSLEDGDIIMTGTPKGVGQVHTQDTIVGKVFSGETLLVEQSWVAQKR